MLSVGSPESAEAAQRATRIFDELRIYLERYPFTERETEIVLLVLRGMSNKEIARSCSITEQTVKDHLKHVYGKMGVHQRTALCARLLGIVAAAPTSQPQDRSSQAA
jgi:DNA-binding NarL/FixJ family response regulator